MTCCGTADLPRCDGLAGSDNLAGEMRLAARDLGDGMAEITMSIPDIHCGDCIRTVERTLAALPQVEAARANLTNRSVTFRVRENASDPELAAIVFALGQAGYPAHLESASGGRDNPELQRLLRALAVAGMASMNIMLLSVSVWSGAEGATRDLFHWISALIAGPAIAYAGMPFFRPALAGLRARTLNMDVPISLALILTFSISVYEVARHAETAWFEAPVMLLFFLLAGRSVDLWMRVRAARDVRSLSGMMAKGAVVIGEDGQRHYVPVDTLRVGMTVIVPAGERVPADGDIIEGASDVDRSVVNGEPVAKPVSVGMALEAGILNLSGPLTIRVSADARDSFIARMQAMIEDAAQSRGRYRMMADRAAALYSPLVHLTALGTFAGWMIITGDWHRAAFAAIATLIITCPCALALAVPMVHAVAAGQLSRDGILLKDGAALEQIADVTTIVFDKTGTLTTDLPRLISSSGLDDEAMAAAAALSRHSNHPFSRGLRNAVSDVTPMAMHEVRELPGRGVEGKTEDGRVWRLGSRSFALSLDADAIGVHGGAVLLGCDGLERGSFVFDETLRPQAAETIAELKAMGLTVIIASGDTEKRVAALARRLGGTEFRASMKPGDKLALVNDLRVRGETVLMVGDGINDAPALAAAHASIAPSQASEIGRSAAGFVFLQNRLDAVSSAIVMGRRVKGFVFQNFAIALLYNVVFVPLAVSGLASPLMAAIAMSTSSIAVIANTMRLRRRSQTPAQPTRQTISVQAQGMPA